MTLSLAEEKQNKKIRKKKREIGRYTSSFNVPVNGCLADKRSEKRAGHQVEKLSEDGVRALLATLQKHLRLGVGPVQLEEQLGGLRLQRFHVHLIPLRKNKNKNKNKKQNNSTSFI